MISGTDDGSHQNDPYLQKLLRTATMVFAPGGEDDSS